MYPAHYWVITTFSCPPARPKVLPATIIISIKTIRTTKVTDHQQYLISSTPSPPRSPRNTEELSTPTPSFLPLLAKYYPILNFLCWGPTDWPRSMLGNAVTFKAFSKITAIGRVVKVFLIKGNVGGIPRTSSYDTTQLSQLGNDGGSCGGWSISSTDRQTGAGKQTGPDIARQSPLCRHNIVTDDIAKEYRAHTIYYRLL